MRSDEMCQVIYHHRQLLSMSHKGNNIFRGIRLIKVPSVISLWRMELCLKYVSKRWTCLILMSCVLIQLFVFIVAEVFPALPHKKLDHRYTGDPCAVRKHRMSNQVRRLRKCHSNDYFKKKKEISSTFFTARIHRPTQILTCKTKRN